MRRQMMLAPADCARRASVTRAAAAVAATPSTTRPGSERTSLRVGDNVRAARARTSRGTWSRYAGREGWVAAVNRQRFSTGATYVEIGVTWTRPTDARNPATDTWFRADELERVDAV